MAKKKEKVNGERIIEELSKIAFYEEEGEGGVKVSEKMKALELIGKHLGIFEEKEDKEERDFHIEVKVVE